ncbi:hypothetical protein NHP190003_06450 [Helicobacter sp. NHP19-003]|uniref:Uncharacterized protein n=1 Tax=Helicobacter gastrocanis TaxID=2849641 RepID=A0ABM7SC48_9HELI|nr:hypothetical protein [Helicobacter sp. NHP19-003]BCZ17363.1 hypothetical protein NHP190003_06450 [Helicobacter sp. NHP19-003]
MSLAERREFYQKAVVAANKNAANKTMEVFEDHMETTHKQNQG